MACFDKLERKTTDGNQSGVASTSKQPEFGMPLNFHENQGLYAAANKSKSTPLALETDKAGLAGVAPSSQLIIYDQNSARNTRTYQRSAANRALAGQNTVLPNPPKSPSQIPILDNAPTAPNANLSDTLNRFREELSKSLEEAWMYKSSLVGLHTVSHTLCILIS
jgi:hypothetical protein